jgi:hypothetical protein
MKEATELSNLYIPAFSHSNLVEEGAAREGQ